MSVSLAPSVERMRSVSSRGVSVCDRDRRSPTIGPQRSLPRRISGLEILRKIRAERIDVGIIAISGYADEETAKKSIELGAFDFIFKPLDLGYLEASLLATLAILNIDNDAASQDWRSDRGSSARAR